MKIQSLTLSSTFSLILCLFCLSGCSSDFGSVSNDPTETAMHIQGVVHGGQQPIIGSRVYMYAADTSAYSGAAHSLLTAATGNTDSNGNHYVLTDASGNFNLDGNYACTPNTQVYLYSAGGSTQNNGTEGTGSDNTAIGLLAVVGNCASANPSASFPNTIFVYMNEVSTIAAVYALAGFATDATHIGSPGATTGHSLATVGIANAFNNALNITNQATGAVLSTTPAGNGTVPVTSINTLADILAACINSSTASSSGCTTLFANALSRGTTGTAPTDTVAAAINIAHNPGTNVSSLLKLVTEVAPFQPTLSSANDFTLGIQYSGSFSDPYNIAIDASGNAWFVDYKKAGITELNPLGALMPNEPSTGYGTSQTSGLVNLAFDVSGNLWAEDYAANSFVEFSGSGSVLSTYSNVLNAPWAIATDGTGNIWASGTSSLVEMSNSGKQATGSPFTGGFYNNLPYDVAVDASGNIWIANNGPNAASAVTEIFNNGTYGSSSASYSTSTLSIPTGVAIDSAGHAWIANYGGTSIVEFTGSNTGGAVSSTYSGGGLNTPFNLSIDGSGNIWVANHGGGSIVELSNSGSILSGTNGFTGGGIASPQFVVLDGSGNGWITSEGKAYVTELLGIATPVVTPLAANLVAPYKQTASKP